MKIVISPNAFKGSLSASDAAFAMVKAVRSVLPDATVVQLPLADGGAGTMDALVESTLGDFIEADCTDAVGGPIVAPWGMLGADLERPRTGIIELAVCCGLKNIPWKKRNPLLTTTFGAGELMMAALDEMCRDLIICLGDTGTHDCGAGLAQAVGIRLLDKHGESIGRGGAELLKLHSIDMTNNPVTARGGNVIAACDVTNPLTGKNSSARVYAAQKGADADGVKVLEEASAHFASVVKRELGKSIATLPGGGAAGGTAAGLAAFFNAELKSGVDLVLDQVQFDAKCLDADLVITGEGRIDKQTTAGKTIAGVCARATKLRVPVIAFAGMVNETDDALRTALGLEKMWCITPDHSTEDEAMRRAAEFLGEKVREVMQLRTI